MHAHDLLPSVRVINLAHRTDRYNRTVLELDRVGIRPQRFEAIGPELVAPDEWHCFTQEYLKACYAKRYHDAEIFRRRLACLRSHRECVREAYESGERFVTVVEDDIVIDAQRFWPVLLRAVAELPEDWRYFVIGTDYTPPAHPYSSHLAVLSWRYGRQMYTLNREGMARYIQVMETEAAGGDWLWNELWWSGHGFMPRQQVVWQGNEYSDIEQRRRPHMQRSSGQVPLLREPHPRRMPVEVICG